MRLSLNTNWSAYDYCNISRDEYLIGIGAMHTEQKAHDVLIKAVAELLDKEYKVNLLITGTGPLQDSLKRLVVNEGIENNVHFLGLIDQNKLYRLLAELDVYSMPSRWEGYCVGVAEAMALGTPCVLSDIKTFKEVYDNCALYHSVDNPCELASTIEQLLSDKNLRENLSMRASELIRSQYNLNDVATQYESLYMDIC
ncbi:glycosyltransferase [Haloarcula japonica DSM 6131]|uniref:Glycosyltransferase n=1 Tax=Haloarcula japonica (strain ATCC 49778 / DSM 6131 / JCM 7785 / NBRC 101032 / NCIMB 13157 / TR-1) TaxID=1227453 RepID=M0LD84_HALJT|nr:glycosyltransferase [Haloarcula japonica DSM 6131]